MTTARSPRPSTVLGVVAACLGATVIGSILTAALSRGDEASDELTLRAILGGRKLTSRSRAFRGGSVTAVLGGVRLDLRDAVPDPTSADLDVVACMGGVRITVPEGWAVEAHATAFAGGLDARVPRPPVSAAPPTLHVHARLCMGGVKILSRPRPSPPHHRGGRGHDLGPATPDADHVR